MLEVVEDLLTTVGARSGKGRTSPVMYHRDAERYVVVASKGGAPDNPDWYNNLKANPVARVEVGTATGTETLTTPPPASTTPSWQRASTSPLEYCSRPCQQRVRAEVGVHCPPVHRDDEIAPRRDDARGGQRGTRADHRRLAGQDPRDPPGPVLGGRDAGAEQALSQRRVTARARRQHPGVRRAHLALQLPQQIVQVIRSADAVEQRPVRCSRVDRNRATQVPTVGV
jgi:deazaflavin-dependent oxidoreductase (nitroreductase family)